MCAGRIIQFILSVFLILSGIAMLFVGENDFVVAPSISANNPLLHGILTDMVLYTLLRVTGGLAIIAGVVGAFSVIAPYNIIAFYLVLFFIVILVGFDLALLIKAIISGETSDKVLISNLLEKTNEYDHDTSIANAWDALHDSSSCCGAEGPLDWLYAINVIPTSCCPADMTEDCDGFFNSQLYQKGCASTVRRALTSAAQLIGAMVAIQMAIAVSILSGKTFNVPYC